MENQHRLIKTYRELNQTEIDLMNECKVLEAQYHVLYNKIYEHIHNQISHASDCAQEIDFNRLMEANPSRWLAISQTQVEQGFMALVRAIAQPSKPKFKSTKPSDEVCGD